MKKIGIGMLAFLALIAVTIGIWFVIPARTDPIVDSSGKAVSAAITELTTIEIGGLDQAVLIRGRDRSKPLLLFLHGGPGMPMMYLAHRFQRSLEDEFVVVQWDQRGAGKSFSDKVVAKDMTVEQFLSDTEALIEYLLKRFGKNKLFLAGHSWGSYLGIITAHRHPELLHAYVGIGQVVSEAEAGPIQDAFIRKKAAEAGNQGALQELNDHGEVVREKWLFEFGGELHGETSWLPLLLAGLAAPEYNLADVLNVKQGSSFSSRYMKRNALTGSVKEAINRLEVPAYFFTGRYDFTTPHPLIEAYFVTLDAPIKKLIWFERSAHFPHFEEPAKFVNQMLQIAKGRVE